MDFKVKTLLKIFGIVILVYFLWLVVIIKTDKLEKIIIEKDSIIEQLNESFEEQQKINQENNKKNKELNEEHEKVKKAYEELEQKYLEEIIPVSFDPNNLWSKSNATVNDMAVALAGTELESVAHVYVEAEKQWGVNAIFLASLTAEESGWGTSDRAVYQNNLTGYAVFSSSAEGKSFTTWTSSIIDTAELICNEYLKESGEYHRGISIDKVNELYCPNDGGQWGTNISNIANSLVHKINNR